MDNGLEFVADTLRDWRKELNIQANYCDPGSPWQDGRIELFNSRLRAELLTCEMFDSMWKIRFMLEEHSQQLQPLPDTQCSVLSDSNRVRH